VKTREQRRAEAVATLLAAFPPGEDLRKAYGARAHKFGVMIRTNGLVRTLSYLVAKGGDKGVPLAYRKFSEHVATALRDVGSWEPKGKAGPETLIAELQTASLQRYMALTRESLALADWFKRFSQSILGVKDVRDAEG
jgi:CRISPR type III-B/RAMP module-associated protein Cmr5